MAALGTTFVIVQMAMIALGYNIKLALTCGLIAAIAWSIHALRMQDRWLLLTNATVGTFATYGILGG
jgi:hypothetical protein